MAQKFLYSYLPAIALAIPIGMYYYVLNPLAPLYFAILAASFLLAYALIRKYAKNSREIPPIFLIAAAAIPLLLCLLPYEWALLFGSACFFAYSFIALKERKRKSEIFLTIGCGILCAIIGINIAHPASIVPATFSSATRSEEIDFAKFNKRADESYTTNLMPGYVSSQQLYKSLVFIGITTDKNNSETLPNYNQANLDIFVNLTDTLPGTESPFWTTNITARFINYDGFVRQRITEGKYEGYDLFNRLKTELRQFSNAWYENIFASPNDVSFSMDFIRMTTYLLVLDITITPTAENAELYTWNVPQFTANIGYNISGSLNFGLEADSRGYAWLIRYLTPQTEAENLFDDLIGIDTFNMMIVFFIAFFISLLVGLLVRNLSVIKVTLITLVALFLIGLFAVMANAMEDTPEWIYLFAKGESGRYLWGIISAVKYAVVLGCTFGIIVMIYGWIATGIEGFVKMQD